MNQLVPVSATARLPTLVVAAREPAQRRFLEFFAASIRNPHTRRAYAHAVSEFLAWCEGRGVVTLTAIQPLHVAAYVEGLTRTLSAPTAKQRLAAVRSLFDWLVVGQVVPVMRWTRSFGQFGGLAKVDSGLSHAASLMS